MFLFLFLRVRRKDDQQTALDEISILSGLSHPHILTLVAAFQISSKRFKNIFFFFKFYCYCFCGLSHPHILTLVAAFQISSKRFSIFFFNFFPFLFLWSLILGKGHNYKNHFIESQKDHRKICKASEHWKCLLSWSEHRKCLLSWSEHQKSKRSERRKWPTYGVWPS